MGAQMLQGSYLAVMEARTADDFRLEVVRFAEGLGFTTVNAIAVIDHSRTRSDFHFVDNTPPAYAQSYHDPSLAQVDPVMQHCKKAAVPIIWDQETYVSQGYGNLWEHQARFGYQAGVALALHLPEGRRHVALAALQRLAAGVAAGSTERRSTSREGRWRRSQR